MTLDQLRKEIECQTLCGSEVPTIPAAAMNEDHARALMTIAVTSREGVHLQLPQSHMPVLP